MDKAGPITVTVVSITSKPPPSVPVPDKPPQVPPRSKKRFNPRDPTELPDSEPPQLPSRSVELIPPPVPPPSTKPASAKQVLHTRQLPETEFLRGSSSSQRQVLVAATKNGRDRRPESRQRQPAMLIRPDREPVLVVANVDNQVSEHVVPVRGGQDHKSPSRKGPHFLVVPASKSMVPALHTNRSHLFPNRNQAQLSRLMFHRPGLPPNGHVLLPQAPIPPLSYGKWLEKSGNGDPEINTRILRRIFGNHAGSRPSKGNPGAGGGFKAILPQNLKAPASPPVNNSKSKLVVSRSGSLSSQYSSCSDSGDNESQPKSVLKKSRRNKGTEKPKKSVTFNAMTTVQVMEE